MRGTPRVVRVGLFLSCVAFATTAQAATYYVAKTGSNNRTCGQAVSELTPKATLNDAVTCLRAGDTLLVRGGTYPEALMFNVPSGTSWSNIVRIAAYPGEIVWLAPNGTNRGLEFANGQQYIEFDGINIEGTNIIYDAVKINNVDPTNTSHHIRIKNATIRNMPGMGITTVALYPRAPGGNEFINLTVYGGGAQSEQVGSTQYGGHHFYIQTDHNLIEYCDIYDALGNGIQVSAIYNGNDVSNNIVRFNRVHDIYRDNPPNGRHRGIVIAGGVDNLVYGNVVYNISGTSDVTAGIEVVYATNTGVYNNTVYNVNKYGFRLDNETSGTILKNNIAYKGGLGDIKDFGTSGLVQSNNMTGTDPAFVNPLAGDFHLRSSSPAINAGTTVPYVTLDLSGTARPQDGRLDLGAYEYVIGSLSLGAPASVHLSR
jgi:hypothetical protein